MHKLGAWERPGVTDHDAVPSPPRILPTYRLEQAGVLLTAPVAEALQEEPFVGEVVGRDVAWGKLVADGSGANPSMILRLLPRGSILGPGRDRSKGVGA
jgi:hypothetical protein